ncbi:XVIPCD domain-containing protein [Silanimonas sp.]|uniref:XVIPCD domain-containing protein n=1 Tax=Silanimonas sp. TaxID=1929290 RepID=UPI0022C0125A|nr:XVIPCD domain-containing protein [Silanimonas sp.]MCZ8114964.1 peptidoglycan-binding protein [Silanimonas sp.]
MPNQRQIDLLRAAVDAGMDSPEELSAFMANICHESGNLASLEESFRYTGSIDDIKVDSAHNRYSREELDAARVAAVEGRPEELARMMYGDRMGNDNESDGYDFRGRGYTQLTGRDNYRAIGEAIGVDLEGNPDLAADPENLSRIAIHYWQSRVPEVARTDIEASMVAINGGDNGADDRRARHTAWSEYLTPETIDAIREGTVVATEAISHRAPPESDGILEHGERGHAVSGLQVDLNRWSELSGSRAEPLPETGNFRDRTQETVLAYQATRDDLEDTGIADQATRDALRQDIERLQQEPVESAPAAPAAAPAAPPVAAPPTETAARDPLFDSVRGHVHTMDRAMGRMPDEASDRLAAALTAECRANGLTRVDGVVLGQKGGSAQPGEYVFAYSGSSERPSDWVGVKTAEAVQTPVEQSLGRAEALQRQQAVEAQQYAQAQQQANDAPVRSIG